MRNLIFGPPGTGKTTRLLAIVEDALRQGVTPEEIGYFSFTRQAANEARDRAIEKFPQYSLKQFQYFRTLHSLAFRFTGAHTSNMLKRKHYVELSELTGYTVTGDIQVDDHEDRSLTEGDRYLFLHNLARIHRRSLREQFDLMNEDVQWQRLKYFADTYDQYRSARGLHDFTDLIEEFLAGDTAPHFKLLVIDEAQDLSMMQWQMVHILERNAEEIHIAGDDDQAIFQWAGAAVDYFVDLEGKTTVLEQSYRIPPEVQAVAERVIQRVGHRTPKAYRPRDAQGRVEFLAEPPFREMHEGQWLILARNIRQLSEVEYYVRSTGLPYLRLGIPSVDPDIIRAIRLYESLRRGDVVKTALILPMLGYTSRDDYPIPDTEDTTMSQLVKMGWPVNLPIWHRAMTKVPRRDRDYMIAALSQGESLTKTPRIRLSTIHGAKGGEADNVVLFTDMAAQTYAEYEKMPDPECRVFYVGLTRARENLFIIEPRKQKYFPI